MSAKQRFHTALRRGAPDRLPVTTHHVMPCFRERYFVTPKGAPTMVVQSNEYTSWIAERPIKKKRDVDPLLLEAYADEARGCVGA